jgi:hypothetical protein
LTREQLVLWIHITRLQEHINECIQQTGRRVPNVVATGIQFPPVDTPLVHNQANEVAEDRFHEEDLRKEFKPDKHRVTIIDMVENVQADGKGHL